MRGHVGLVIIASGRHVKARYRGLSLGHCSDVCLSSLRRGRAQRILDWRWSSSSLLSFKVELNITRRTQISDSLPVCRHNPSLGNGDVAVCRTHCCAPSYISLCAPCRQYIVQLRSFCGTSVPTRTDHGVDHSEREGPRRSCILW